MAEYKVGQVLWYVPSDRRDKPRFETITKIGRKWITVRDGWKWIRLDMEDGLRADGGAYNSPGRAYLTEGEYVKELILNQEWNDFASRVKPQSRPEKVTMEDIWKVREILFKDV